MPPKPLRILMISTDRNIFREGSEVRERMKEYAAFTKELHIIVFSVGGNKFEKTQISPNCFAYPTNSLNRWFYVQDAINLGKRFDREAKNARINLVTAQDPFESGFAGFKISKKLLCPIQFQIHTDFLNPSFVSGNLLNRIRVHIAKKLLHEKCDVRVVSENIRSSILRQLKFKWNTPPRITVLPVFIDAEKFKNAPVTVDLHKEYPFLNCIVLVVSRLEKEKNTLLAIRLVKEVIRSTPGSPNLGLVIVGDGSEREMLEKYSRDNGLDKNVFFLGWKEDIATYYKTADLLLVTSDYEGYQRMCVESVASGCPVLTFDVGAAKEILESWNGMICDAGDEQCMYKHLLEIATDQIYRSTFKSTAVNEVRRLKFPTKEEYLEKYKKMWHEAADSKDFEVIL